MGDELRMAVERLCEAVDRDLDEEFLCSGRTSPTSDALAEVRRLMLSASRPDATDLPDETSRRAVAAWLDESEGFGIRRERVPGDGADGENVVRWLETAYGLGRAGAYLEATPEEPAPAP